MQVKSGKIVLLGPYLGDFKEELLSFRPLVKWVYDNLDFDAYFLSSHINRRKLYSFISDECFLPVYEKLSREENKQVNSTHQDINIKDYNYIILKNIKEKISENSGFFKKDVIQYGLSYIKSQQNNGLENKVFDIIPYNKKEKKEYIVFIPDFSEKEEILKIVLDHLESNYKYDYLVIGDNKCYFPEHNILKQRIDYFETVYDLAIDYISNAKLVICPCSHWTVLANQQRSFVFSWGRYPSPYKTEGTYGFNNRNVMTSFNKLLIERNIKNQIDFVIRSIGDKNV